MPDVDEKIGYGIETTANLSGQKAAIKGFQDVKNAAKEAGDQSEKSGRQDEEHGKKAEFLGLKTGELRKLTRELGHEFPIAGMAARAMLNVVAAAFTGAIALFALAKSKLDEWDKALDEAAEKNAERDFMPGIEAKAAALDEAATSVANFSESLKAIGASEDSFSTKIKNAIGLLHEFIAAQAEINSAAEANELAKVNLNEKLGKVKPEEAIAQRSNIREAYRKREEQLKTEGENKEIKLQEAQYKHDLDQAPGLESDAINKQGVVSGLQARLNQSKTDLPKAEEKLAELNKKMVAAQADRDESHQLAMNMKGWARPDMTKQAPNFRYFSRGNPEQDAETAEKEYQRQKALVESLKKDAKEIPQQLLPHAASEAGIAEARAKANQERIARSETELPAAKDILATRQGARQITSGIKSDTETTETAAQLAEKLSQGKEKLTELHQQAMRLSESGKGLTQAILDALTAQEKSNESIQRRLEQFETRLKSTERTRSLVPPGN